MNASTSSTSTSTATANGAAPFWRLVLAQTRAELMMTLRNGERVLVTIAIPIGLLVFFSLVKLPGANVDSLISGVLALALMSTGMVSLAIATGYERFYGVLKRLGASPLSRAGLILAKMASVLVVEVAQVAAILVIGAIFLHWRPTGNFFLFLLVFVLGAATFSGLGMLMAGALRAEATLAAANGLYLLFVLVGGTVVPMTALPRFIQPILYFLPSAALSDALHGSLAAGAFHGWSLVSLIAWCVAFLAAAALTFKWE